MAVSKHFCRGGKGRSIAVKSVLCSFLAEMLQKRMEARGFLWNKGLVLGPRQLGGGLIINLPSVSLQSQWFGREVKPGEEGNGKRKCQSEAPSKTFAP